MKRGIEDFAKDNIRRQVPGVKDKGFLNELLEAYWKGISKLEEPDDEEAWTRKEFFDSQKSIVGFRPNFISDMFYIDEENRLIYFYEIEDTHPLTREKLDKIRLWILNHGDEEGWHGRLIVTDRYGLNHRMIFAYEHTLGPEPYPEEDIQLPFPSVFKQIRHFN